MYHFIAQRAFINFICLYRRMVSLEDIKLPPHNIDAEKGTLGGVLMDNELMYYYDGIGLAPEDFYQREHFYIYQGMKKLR